MQFTIACPKCGGTEMRYDTALGDETPVTCNKCETELGTLAEVRASAVSSASNQYAEALKKKLANTFDGEGGIKFIPK